MSGNIGYQILRGSETYDPSTSEEVLLDGQLFYSKKTKELFVGDGESTLALLKGTQIGLSLENAEGVDSIVMKYSGPVDDSHYGNTNTGESSVVFGEANTNSANRALLSGKLNFNSGAQAILGGKGNENTTEDAIVGGKYCIDTKNALLKIGNGTDDSHRSNAFEVLKDGRAKSYVDIKTITLEDNDLVPVAYMKQYIKEHFTELMNEYLAENNTTQ